MSSAPPWDLLIVHQALTQYPYEPLETIPLNYLSWKTACLFALASGKKRSEIHTIRRSKVYHTDDWTSITCNIDHFLCKNQTYDVSGSMFDSFKIPALGPTLEASMKEDNALCTVRAIRTYMERTERKGKNKRPLWVFCFLKID